MTTPWKLAALCAASVVAISTAAYADTSGMKIAFSNNYAGNSWRQAMLKSYDIVTKKAVADKIVAAADVFTTADKEVPTQAAQIQNLILQGYNAIVINAASPDALNGAIKQACDAGIVVVSFDGIVTEPCAYRVVVDFKDMGKQEVEQMAKFQPKGGNLLEIRGLAGTSIDDAIHARHSRRREGASRLQDRRSVTGDWDQTTAQKAVATVLPSLPPIVGVVDQGGDGYGAAQAFAAAGKPRPTIIEGNRQDELQWWKEQKEKDGYTTWSASIAPGVSTLAFWVAQQVLDGNKNIPHDLLVPYLAFTQADFEAELPNIAEGRRRQPRIHPGRRHRRDQGEHEVTKPRGRRRARPRASGCARCPLGLAQHRRPRRRRKVFRRRSRARRRRSSTFTGANASASSATTAPASRR